MGALLGRNDGCVADKRVVNTRVRNQVGLEFIQIHIERTVEPQRGRDGGNNLGDEAVQVLVVRAGNIQATAADVVHGFVIDEECAVRVLNRAVRGEDGVVRLNNRGGDARSRVDGKFELALLAVVRREPFEEESTESRSSSTTEGVEDQEALKRGAVV